jgi:hypothetical protein
LIYKTTTAHKILEIKFVTVYVTNFLFYLRLFSKLCCYFPKKVVVDCSERLLDFRSNQLLYRWFAFTKSI